METLITRRGVILSTAAVAATSALGAVDSADQPQRLFAYLSLAEPYGRPHWRHPVLLRHKGEFLTGRLAACVEPANDGPLPVYALLFGDIRPVEDPRNGPFARACAIDVCDTVEKAERYHRSDSLHFRANGYAVNHWI